MKSSHLIFCGLSLALIAISLPRNAAQCPTCVSCVTGPPDYMCPSPPNTFEVYFPHESYCTRFYKCVNGKAVEGRCPSGTYFNPQQNVCCPDKSLCYRSNPCVMPVPGCVNCANKFVNSELMSSAFFVCNCDGTGVTTQCPAAFDLCTNSTVQLVFANGKCDPPVLSTTTTTTEAPTTTTEAATTTTAEGTTTTTAAAETTTTTAEGTTTTEGVTP